MNRRYRYVHIGLAVFTLALCFLFIFLLIVHSYLPPDLFLYSSDLFLTNSSYFIIGAGVSIVVTMITLLRAIVACRRLFDAWIDKAIMWLDRYVLTTILASCILIVTFVLGGKSMLIELIDRYRYVGDVRQAVESVLQKQLPDTERLVEAYLRFPERREIPVLLVRIGHVASRGGWKDFVSFQETYADQLYMGFQELPNWCSISGVHHDPVSYVAMTYIESSVPLKNNKPYGSESFQNRLKLALELLTCPGTKDRDAERREIPRMIYAARVRSILGKFWPNIDYDPKKDIQKIEQEIDTLDEGSKNWLFQSLAYQEFLDFRIKTTIQSSDPVEPCYTDITLDSIADDIRRLLDSRHSRDNEILWNHAPGKMDTYRMIMAKEKQMNHDISILLPYVNNSGVLSKKIDEIFKSPSYQEFRNKNRWRKSTPADLSITELSFKKIFETWLKTGWNNS